MVAPSCSKASSLLIGRMGNRLLHSCCSKTNSPSITTVRPPGQTISSIHSSSRSDRNATGFSSMCLISKSSSVLSLSYYEAQSHHLSIYNQTHRNFASKRNIKRGRSNNKSPHNDENAPLLNEHLIAELFNQMNTVKGGGGGSGGDGVAKISADTFEVRLIVDAGRGKKGSSSNDDNTDDDDDNDSNNNNNNNKSSSSNHDTQIVTLNEAINMSHELSLDLMEVTLKQDPPVIKAVSYDKWLYDQKKKQSKKKPSSDRKKGGGEGGGGGGAISDRPLKEFKFRAGIADHDLERKANNMLQYLSKGHAIRVTLTARQRSLNEDAQAISTTLDRVKELIGDKAVEVRGMKANERKSYGNLLLHPNKNS